jgi:hypothetical protein
VSTAAPVAIFTGSGESVFIDELIDKVWSAIEASWRTTLKEVATTVEQSNRGYHETIWKLYPHGTARSDLPSADLIIALWAKDGFGLYETRSATFRSVKDFATVGAGESLAHYICDSAHNSIVKCAKTVVLANYMLDKVKNHVPGCGGQSRIAILTSNGGAKLLDRIQIDQITELMSLSEGLVRQILLTNADLDQTDEMFQAVARFCEKELIEMRQSARAHLANIADARQQIAEQINKVRAAAQRELASEKPKHKK